jgi:signal transduction histidine kinase
MEVSDGNGGSGPRARRGAGALPMRTSQAQKRRLAEGAYLLDRALKNPASSDDFAQAAIDTVRLALRPAYVALLCRIGSSSLRCGDSVLSADVDAAAEVLGGAPRSLLARPRTLRRSELAAAGVAALERPMAAAALELACPLADDGALLGVLVLGPRANHAPYTDDELEFLDRIAARIAVVAARDALAAEATKLRAAAAASERLASVGRMAAGLAHEIRNPLVSIRTFTQLLPERHADEEFRNGFLDLTLAEIDRISALVGEILSYARPESAAGRGDDGPPVADVGECVERTCLLLRSHARGAGVSLEFEGTELFERAAIDEDKLRQVVINLIVNGIQACDGRGRVRVSVRTGEAIRCGAPRLVVEVADDGPGMNREVAGRVFAPFFTTRREGTGLGLALVKSFLDEAGASIALDTAPGRGTTFRIELLTESAAASAALPGTAVSPALPAAVRCRDAEDLAFESEALGLEPAL